MTVRTLDMRTWDVPMDEGTKDEIVLPWSTETEGRKTIKNEEWLMAKTKSEVRNRMSEARRTKARGTMTVRTLDVRTWGRTKDENTKARRMKNN